MTFLCSQCAHNNRIVGVAIESGPCLALTSALTLDAARKVCRGDLQERADWSFNRPSNIAARRMAHAEDAERAFDHILMPDGMP